MWIAVALVAAVVRRRPEIAVATTFAVLAAYASSEALKRVVDRERPFVAHPSLDALGPEPSSPSFPSGHAAVSFSAALVLGSLVPVLLWPALLVALAVSWSRLYLGVHYPLDVLAGALLGAAVGAIVVRALRRLRSVPRR